MLKTQHLKSFNKLLQLYPTKLLFFISLSTITQDLLFQIQNLFQELIQTWRGQGYVLRSPFYELE